MMCLLFLDIGNDCYQMDTDYPGNDIQRIQSVNDYMECKRHCDFKMECAVFTYVDDPNHSHHKDCFLKNEGADNLTQHKSFVSGEKICFKAQGTMP